MSDALVLSDVRHSFGRTLALDNAQCRVRRGTVHALLGENGAGKSTLMRVAFGLLSADGGRLEVDGRPVHFRSSADAIAAGIGMVHQHFLLVPALTATENVALGGRGLLHRARAVARVKAFADRSGLSADPSMRVDQMTVGAQQRLEILRALAHDSRVLILDEPTAVLTPEEGMSLLRWVRGFVDGGGTAILITHKLREALAIADDVTVLRRGRTVLSRPRVEVDEAMLVEAVTGDAASESALALPAPARRPTEPVLALDKIDLIDGRGVTRLRDASLEVYAGEVVGVVGVEGSGQRELLRILAGRLRPTRGRVIAPRRVGFVPEDRLADALVPEMTLTENLVLAEAGSARGRLDWRAATERTAALLVSADVRADGPSALARELSGGNQQKFVVARERARSDAALVVEHPTRGLDIRASARVWDELLRAAREQQLAVVVYSPDLDEVRAIADRVVVCFAGNVRAMEGGTAGSDRASLGRALLGVN